MSEKVVGALKYKIADYSSAGKSWDYREGGNARPKMHFTTAPELNQCIERGGEMLA